MRPRFNETTLKPERIIEGATKMVAGTEADCSLFFPCCPKMVMDETATKKVQMPRCLVPTSYPVAGFCCQTEANVSRLPRKLYSTDGRAKFELLLVPDL